MRGMKRVGAIGTSAAPALLAMSLTFPGCHHAARSSTAGCGPRYFPPPPSPPRIAYLGSVDELPLVRQQPGRMARFLFGEVAKPALAVAKPFGLAAANGKLLVCDSQQGLVHVVDFAQRKATKLGESGAGRLIKPIDVDVDPREQRYIADTARQEVVVYSAAGEALRALRPDPQTPFKPIAVAFVNDSLYVVNGALQRVEVLDPMTGALRRSFGDSGPRPERLHLPSGIAVSADGHVFVADLISARVVVFDSNGKFLRSVGRPGNRAGEFTRPKHLAIGSDDILYVVDAAFQRVQMFDAQDRVLMLFGGPGEEPGALALPAGICTDRSCLPHFAHLIPKGFVAEDLVFVSDQFGRSKVNVYALGKLRPPGNNADEQ